MKTSNARIQWLREHHAAALQKLASMQDERAWLHRDGHAFAITLAMDPTKKGVYLRSIVRWLQGRHIQFEDARRVRTTLAEFDRIKHRLPVERRDIGFYGNPGYLDEQIQPLVNGGAIEVPAEILAISPIVAVGRGWSLHEVACIEAAQWWAKGSSWCTSNALTAKRYLNWGALHVIVAGSTKFQFHGPTDQLRDSRDRMVMTLPDALPIEAVHALVGVLLEPLDDAKWYPGEALLRLYDIMDEHDAGSRRLSMPSAVGRKGQRPGSIWMSSRHGELVLAQKSSHRMGSGIAIHSTPLARIEWTERLLVAEQVWAEIAISGSLVFDMIQSGVARVLASRSQHADDGWLNPRIVNEMQAVFGNDKFTIKLDEQNSPSVGIFIEPDNGPLARRCPMKMLVVDFKAPIEERVHLLKDAEDLARMPSHVRRTISDFQRLARGYAAFEMFGRSAIDEVVGDEWRSSALRSLVLEMATQLEWKEEVPMLPGSFNTGMPSWESNFEEMTRLVFADLDHVAIWGMIKSLREEWRCEWSLLSAKDGSIPGAVEALLSIKHVHGAGYLLAAIPDAECTDELVEELIAAGRSEAVSVLPWRMITRDRLDRGATASTQKHKYGKRVAARSLSPRLMEIFGEEHRLVRLHDVHKDLFEEKGTGLVNKVVRRWKFGPNAPDNSDDTARIMAMDLPDRERLALAFRDVPLLGRPWPLVVQALRVSLDGIEDVVIELPGSAWAGIDGKFLEARMKDLMAIPGASERIAVMSKKSAS